MHNQRKCLLKRLEYFNQLHAILVTFEHALWEIKLSNAPLPLSNEAIKETTNLIAENLSEAEIIYDKTLINEIEKEIDDFRKTPHSRIRDIRVDEIKSLGEISGYCNLLCDWYNFATTTEQLIDPKPYTDTNNLLQIDILGMYIIEKAYELMGYWTAKVEKSRSSIPGTKKKITDKENRKALLKEWMKTMKPKDLRRKGQSEFDVTDRTILKYLQEIRGEETAILRNKADTT